MTAAPATIVLIGLESVGKSALFRALTGQAVGDETNFRGSTVMVRMAALQDRSHYLVDTPGIRVQDDSETTRLALEQVDTADTVVLVVRGTHAHQEIDMLLHALQTHLPGRKAVLCITFEDKAAPEIQHLVAAYTQRLGIPVTLVNARDLRTNQRQALLQSIQRATPLPSNPSIILLPDIPVIQPQQTIFERRWLGPWVSILVILLLFVVPVYLAYLFADWFQPLVDDAVITPLVQWLDPVAQAVPLLHFLLVGDYGLLTLGWYSFLWAFPVVLLLGISVAVTEEIGIKDRITAALDPWLRRIGLSGRDLVPVLSGFGCNVVAVFQTRSCSVCTRKACISMIAFGSACSYQIGASLSLFNAGHVPWLFAPYLFLLFLVGAIHTRIWHTGLASSAAMPLHERAFLQSPTWRGVWWRVKAVLKQFLLQAMPIFLTICLVGSLLAYGGLLDRLADGIAPLLALFGLPATVAPGIIFSIVRKDGLLILNQSEGALLTALTAGQILILVYLASTLTACMVTLWTIRKELGARYALLLAGQQMLTALVSTLLLAVAVFIWRL